MRTMTSLTNHWVTDTGRVKRAKLDYNMRKMKEELTEKKAQKIKYSKIPENRRELM